ncbi:hypothetical protein Pan153_01090 [Gimesia panareensis]|uniref:Uncharacterized protein n=1 Tax=Gimesia panareensis TaxID=2527978 RepID=A0A518FGM9_9PLAN|nr:hypothetical protein [Gimesia panareensis]QDV15495.1 hypothetical protein Pan153_01090 [Gimesia panareensis]
MKTWNKKQTAWSMLILLSALSVFVGYHQMQKARAQTASINAALDSLLQEGCQLRVERCNHPTEELPPPVTSDVNQELKELVTQLKQLPYQSRLEPGVPACGDRVVLTSLCHQEYAVWISALGVFLIPEGGETRVAYDSQSDRSTDRKVFQQATQFFQSLQ